MVGAAPRQAFVTANSAQVAGCQTFCKRCPPPHKPVNLGDLMREFDDAKDEEAAKRLRQQTGG